MGKRSNFKRIERDFYSTPEHALKPLLSHLPRGSYFHEPCAGDGALVFHLHNWGMVVGQCGDIEPQCHTIDNQDVFDLMFCEADMFITNPPYDWKILSPLITHLSDMAPTWLLLPADMMHNIRMASHIKRCAKIVSVGRVKWFGNQSGMENSAWYLFDSNFTGETVFFGRDTDV